MSQFIGQTLDRYQITALLGRGGMGSVYRAHDLTLRRDVALKVMHAHLAEIPEFKARFVQEAQAAANLDHDGIVKVYDFKDSGEVMYIVMEYLAGGNLKQMLQRMRDSQRWLLLSDTTSLVQQLALALDYAHRRGVLHRDVKPANIMLKPDAIDGQMQRPVITDMGLAKLAESSVVTQTGESMGTPAYMAPEQALGKPVGPGVDIYALGVVLYELAVGELPHTAKTLAEAFKIHNNRTPPPAPTKRRPDVPADLEWVILRALAFDPAQRFASAREFANALTDATVVTTVATVPAGATKGALGLGTLYQESLSEPPAASPVQQGDETEHPDGESVLSIQIVEPSGATRSVEVTASKISIGREPDNLIQLMDDQKVSRHHVRITLEGDVYKVVDLNSTNGTYLGDSKLLPAVPEPWLPNKPLRLGSHTLYLQRSSHQGAPPPISPVTVGVLAQETRPTENVMIRLATDQVSVDPGGSVELVATIRNASPTVGHLSLALTGVPAEWVVLPPPVYLMPGDQEEAVITIRPPRAPSSLAGKRTMGLSAKRKDTDTALTTQQVVLTIREYAQLALTIEPERQRSDESAEYLVSVSNEGNSILDIKLSAQDDRNECEFVFDTPEISLSAGTTHTAQLGVRQRATPGVDAERTYTFSVNVQSIGSPDIRVSQRAEWTCNPPRASFELALHPARRAQREFGEFNLEVSNTSRAATTIRFVGYDEQVQCTYTFDPAQVSLGPGQKQIVELTVRSKAKEVSRTTRTHRFTVSAASAESPASTKQVAGEWEELAAAPKPPSPPPLPKSEEDVGKKSKPSQPSPVPVPRPTPAAPAVQTGFWFWLRWVVVSAAMWMGMWILAWSTGGYLEAESLMLIAAYGAVIGLVGSFLQWLMLRTRTRSVSSWIPVSVIAWGLGSAFTALLLNVVGVHPSRYSSPDMMISAGTAGLLILNILRLPLRKTGVGFFWWVVVTALAVGASGYLTNPFGFSYYGLINGLIFGGMTGLILVSALRGAATRK